MARKECQEHNASDQTWKTTMPLVDPVTMSGISAAPQARSSMPIDLLPNDIARVATHLQPIIYLSSFYLRFPALVSDPVSALLISLIPLALCQAAYCILCLPATNVAAKSPKKSQKSKTVALKKPSDQQPTSNISVGACTGIERLHCIVAEYKTTIARRPLPSSNCSLCSRLNNPRNSPRRSTHHPSPTNASLLRTPRPLGFVSSLLRPRH
jgi:hypothetical protein